jgi:hypothetical protein
VPYGDCSTYIDNLPPGKLDNTSSKNYEENTALCRKLHLDVAKTTDPDVHCQHASADGGDSCTIQFCQQYEKHCVKPQYSHKFTNCLEGILKMKIGMDGDLYGNTRSCREKHMSLAVQNDELARVHCPHASPTGDGYCVD